ncbi:hypothetical protein WJX75_007231 [Coccomyxa subellipsoidea]|uniref:RNI-like protein n=1 Tax=Coccomyxa subellipsoidea TaxID=248742 RepID=A0ABR2YWI4_9CHLO
MAAALPDLLKQITDVSCLHVIDNFNPTIWIPTLLGRELPKHHLDELVLPLYPGLALSLQMWIQVQRQHNNWDGLTKLDFSVPDRLEKFNDRWDANIGDLVCLLPNLTIFSAQNSSIGIHTWMALAEGCSGSIKHIDFTGCRWIGALSGEGRPEVYVTALAHMSQLQSLHLGGTQIAGIFEGLGQNTAAKRVAANLQALDISDPEVEGVSPTKLLDTVATLLRTAVSLRSFSATGMKCMAGSELQVLECLGLRGCLGPDAGSEDAELGCNSQPKFSCSLLHLAVGLGFNGAKLCAVIRGSEFLTSLTVGLGAQINDADLEAVSRLCPHLQRLKLRFAMVSDTGVCKVVRACRSLTVLQLMRCSGPFGDELGAAFLSRRPLLLLKELRIVGGAQLLTDQGLAKCISRSIAQLHALELARCPSLTPGALSLIGQHAGTLEILALVHCDSISCAQSGDLTSMVETCKGLRSLTLRHCATKFDAHVLLPHVKDNCRLLRVLCLDACDLTCQAGYKVFASARSASSAPDSTESAESVLERFDFATGEMHTWEWKLQAWLLCGRLQSDFKHLRFTNGDRVVDVR